MRSARRMAFAREKGIDYAVVAPDDPLVLGCVDALEAIGVPCFGPRKNAAIIEGSKVFSKDLMKKYGIPTAAYEVFTSPEEALRYLETAPIPTVVKADGLALGKGVTVAMTREEACDAVREAMEDKKFGESGNRIVIEEYLEGPEVSVLSFTDGNVVVPMVSSMDHKRAGDGDTGPNTGGMGTIAPNPYYTDAVAAECMEKIFLPTIRAMKAEGRELESDLLTVMRACTYGTLAECKVKFREGNACCVVLASKGYPGSYGKGYEITIPERLRQNVYVAGAVLKDGKLETGGGRVLGVTAVAKTLPEAVKDAYAMAEQVTFENRYYRKDIGARALKAVK